MYFTIITPMRLFFISIFSILLFTIPISSWALTDEKKFVRTANYYLKAGFSLKESDFDRLSSYDLLVLPMEAASYNKDFFEYARKKNPNIIILAYVPSRSINTKDIEDGAQIRKRLKQGIHDEWYLREGNGNLVKGWPETLPLNLTSPWNQYLPRFIKETILSSGLWDGIFYDEIDTTFSLFNNGVLDLNRDGLNDAKKDIDDSWNAGVTTLLQKSREIFGTSTIIMTNGSSYPSYQTYINGRMFERFPTPWEGNGNWSDSMKSYIHLSGAVGYTPLFIINGTTENTGKKDDYARVRYGLTSTLLGDGYYGFDFGDRDHGQLWWYDEFDVALGKPLSQATRVDTSDTNNTISPGVWRREFQHGVVFINSLSNNVDLTFPESYEKIRGAQDPITNNGSIVSSLSLPSQDGILLLRPIDHIVGTFFKNGSFTRIVDKDGKVKRNGFFAYDQRVRGSALLAFIDLDHDGREERISIDRGTISLVWSSTNTTISFIPFKKWSGDINATFIDANNDGVMDIAVSPEHHSKNTTDPVIKIFDMKTITQLSSLYPFGRKFLYSIRVAAADLDGDGFSEIIASSGVGSKSLVRIFDARTNALKKEFSPYDIKFRGGVSIAAGDINGDGTPEIITAPGSGGTSHIRIFNALGKALTPGFLAFQSSQRSGIRVAAADLDGDGRYEILPMTMNVFTVSALTR